MTTRRTIAVASGIYGFLILYGSLYPFTGWRLPDEESIALLTDLTARHVSRSDAVTNLLAYMPLGFLVTVFFARKGNGTVVVVATTVIGCLLSASVEVIQLFLPSRVASSIDFVLNGGGTFVGGCAAWWWRGNSSIMERMREARHLWFFPGRTVNVSLAVPVAWALSQLAPFVPSLDVGNLRFGLKPLWQTLHGLKPFSPHETLVYACSIAGLGVIVLLSAKDTWRGMAGFAIFVATVLVLKVPIVGRQLSLEAAIGCVVAFLLIPLVVFLPRRGMAAAAAALVLVAYVVGELRPTVNPADVLHVFNWIPFRPQMASLMGLASILESIWPFFGLASLLLLARIKALSAVVSGVGLFILILTFCMEWEQQYIPGRYPDITQLLIALAGWAVPFVYAWPSSEQRN